MAEAHCFLIYIYKYTLHVLANKACEFHPQGCLLLNFVASLPKAVSISATNWCKTTRKGLKNCPQNVSRQKAATSISTRQTNLFNIQHFSIFRNVCGHIFTLEIFNANLNCQNKGTSLPPFLKFLAVYKGRWLFLECKQFTPFWWGRTRVVDPGTSRAGTLNLRSTCGGGTCNIRGWDLEQFLRGSCGGVTWNLRGWDLESQGGRTWDQGPPPPVTPHFLGGLGVTF